MKIKVKIYLIALITIIMDQLSKLFIVNNYKSGDVTVIFDKLLEITYVENYGAAWGLLSGNTIILVLIGFTGLMLVNKFLINQGNNITKFEVLVYGLLIGGITGNLLDRIFRGYVVDFIDTYIFGYNFPVFNIGDIAIVCGAILLVVATMLEGKNGKNRNNT